MKITDKTEVDVMPVRWEDLSVGDFFSWDPYSPKRILLKTGKNSYFDLIKDESIADTDEVLNNSRVVEYDVELVLHRVEK